MPHLLEALFYQHRISLYLTGNHPQVTPLPKGGPRRYLVKRAMQRKKSRLSDAALPKTVTVSKHLGFLSLKFDLVPEHHAADQIALRVYQGSHFHCIEEGMSTSHAVVKTFEITVSNCRGIDEHSKHGDVWIG